MRVFYTITLLALTVIVAINVGVYFAPDRMCLGGGYFLLKNTDTFHSLHKGDSHFLQGFVEGIKVEGKYVYGYLSLKHVTDDSLDDLLNENDREGYFLLDTTSGQLQTGLVKSQLLAGSLSGNLSDTLPQPSFDERACGVNKASE